MRTWMLIAGLSLGALAPVQAQDGRLAERLPAETFLYFEIPDIQALIARSEDSALGQIWHDAEMQAFTGQFLPLLDDAWARLRQHGEAMGLPPALMSWEAPASLEIGLAFKAAQSPEGMPRPALAFGVSIGLKDGLAEAVEGFLVGMAEAGQIPCQVVEDGGQRCLVVPMGRDEGLEIRRRGNQLVAYASMGSFTGDSLAGSPRFQAARALHAQDRPVCFGFLDFARSAREGIAMLRMVPKDQGAKLADVMDRMMAELGLYEMGPLSLSSGWRSDGLGYTKALVSFGEGGPQGVMADSLALHADVSLVDYVPADAVSFSIMASDIGMGWDMCCGMMEEFLTLEAEGHPGQTVGDLWAASGHPSYDWLMGDKRPLLNKAMEGFGHQGFSYSTAAGGGGYFQRLDDPAAVSGLFHELMPMAAEALAGIEDLPLSLSVKTAKVYETGPDGKRVMRDGPEYYVLRIVASKLPEQFRPAAMFLGQFSPSLGINEDGWLIAGINSANVRAALRSGVSKPEKNIRSNPDAAAFLDRLPQGAQMFSWSDPRPGLEQAWGMLQGVLPMVTMNAPDLPVDLSTIPPASSITSHLRPSESWTTMTREMQLTQSTGSFQLADVFVAVGSLAAVVPPLILMGELQESEEMPMEAVEEEPAPISGANAEQRQQVADELERLRSGVVVYMIENGKLPGSLDTLLLATDRYPEGYLPATADGRHGLFPDPWGHPYLYKVEGGEYRLYSAGPDGQDDNGGDDDIGLEG